MSKTLNLVYPDKSGIKFKISRFPDGQQNLTILGDLKDCEDGDITIKSRLNNFMDLELIVCAVKSIRGLFYGNKGIRLYVPFFLGSRSDRCFEEGGNNYLKDVICPIINGLNFESVLVFDPHSDILEACLNNFKKCDNKSLVGFALNDLKKGMWMEGFSQISHIKDNFVLISPDAGASKKIYKLAEQIGYKGDIITCSKDRDKDGRLTRCVVPMKPEYTTKDLILIDDVADGANTFINIAKEIDNYNKNYKSIYGKKYLIVTHGIFSKGFEELNKYFDGIYCTNSYRDIPVEFPFDKVKAYPVDENKMPIFDRIKQLNVF